MHYYRVARRFDEATEMGGPDLSPEEAAGGWTGVYDATSGDYVVSVPQPLPGRVELTREEQAAFRKEAVPDDPMEVPLPALVLHAGEGLASAPTVS